MNKQYESLINELSRDLSRTNRRRLFPPLMITLIWLSLALVVTGVWMYVLQPFRPDVWQQFLSVPLFSSELLIGVLGLGLLCLGVFKSAIPSEKHTLLKVGLVCYLVWLTIILSGYLSPILAPSMDGKRDECYFESIYYSIALAIVLTVLIRRRYTLQPLITAPLIAFVVVTVPAYLMQIACMHEVHHAFTHHLLPAWIEGVLLSPVLYWVLKKPAK